MIDLTPFQDAIADVKEKMDDPTPTPPVGKNVRWFKAAKKDMSYAAIVTLVQGAGKVKLDVFEPDAFVTHKTGVLPIGDPIHAKRHNQTSRDCGAWDYIEGDGPAKRDYDVHLAKLKKQLEGFENQLADAEAANKEEAAKSKKRQPAASRKDSS